MIIKRISKTHCICEFGVSNKHESNPRRRLLVEAESSFRAKYLANTMMDRFKELSKEEYMDTVNKHEETAQTLLRSIRES